MLRGRDIKRYKRGAPQGGVQTDSAASSALPRAAACISQVLIIVFQRQILRRGGKEEKPSQGPLPWSSVVTQELAVTLVPEKITAMNTEGSSDHAASHPAAPAGTMEGVLPSEFLSQAEAP